MSKYKVIKPFYDVKHHANYFIDESYPKEGMKADIDRLEELSSDKNGIGTALIEEIEVDEPEKEIETEDSKEEVQEVKEEKDSKKDKKGDKKAKDK